MREDTHDSVFRAVKHFFSGTMLSRITGLARDMAMTFFFGASPLIAAFMMAFRFSNLLRRIFGEGPLQSALIPHFEEIRKEDPQRAKIFFKEVKATIFSLLFVITILVEVSLWMVLYLGDLNENNAEIIRLTALMFPGIIFICLYGINSSLLQCEHKYFITGVAPVAFNLIWVLAVIILRNTALDEAMTTLSFFIVLAYLFQWLITVPSTWKFLKGGKFGTLFSKDVRKLAAPVLLGIIGVSAAQVNSTLDPIFARSADLEGPAYLWYAIRLQQLPLALLGIAFSGALLPSLSRAVKAGDLNKYFSLLHFGLRRSFGLMIPITFALIAMGSSCVTLLYGRGAFSDKAIYETIYCLWGYVLGLLPMTAVLLFAAAFYAKNDFSKSAKASLLSMLINVLLNSLFVFGMGMGSASVAFATSIASLFNALFMFRTLPRNADKKSGIGSSVLRVGVASSIAFVATIAFGHFFLQDATLTMALTSTVPQFSREFMQQCTMLCLEGLCFTAVLIVSSFILKANDLLILRKVNS